MSVVEQIMSSRSFSRLLTERGELEEAVASYMSTAAEKLRRQHFLASVVQVDIRTNIFKPHEPSISGRWPYACRRRRTTPGC